MTNLIVKNYNYFFLFVGIFIYIPYSIAQVNSSSNLLLVGISYSTNEDRYYSNNYSLGYSRVIAKEIELAFKYSTGSGGLKAKYILDKELIQYFELDDGSIVNFLQLKSMNLGLFKTISKNNISLNIGISANINWISKSSIDSLDFDKHELKPTFATFKDFGYSGQIGLSYNIGEKTYISFNYALHSILRLNEFIFFAKRTF